MRGLTHSQSRRYRFIGVGVLDVEVNENKVKCHKASAFLSGNLQVFVLAR